jgi:hypothetical protein
MEEIIMKNKVCSFFVSETHLLTILLPYIDEKISEGKKVELVLEKDMKNDLNKFLNNVKNLNINKEKIERLNWKSSKFKLNNLKNSNEVIVVGNKRFIEKVNKDIDDKCEEVVNFFDMNMVENLKNILIEYDEVLKTSGKEMLIKNSQNAQKRKTIQSQI